MPNINYELYEKILLGNIIANNDYIPACLDYKLQPECFANNDLGRFFGVIVDIYNTKQSVTAIDLQEYLNTNPSMKYLAFILDDCQKSLVVIDEIEISNYIQSILKAHYLRQSMRAIADISRTKDMNEVVELVKKFQSSIPQLLNYDQMSSKMVFDLSGDLNRFVQDLDSGPIKIVNPFGFSHLDAVLGGLVPSRLYAISGRPGMGKTAFCLNIVHNLLKHNRKVLIFSLEMNQEEIYARLFSSALFIPNSRIISHQLTKEEIAKIDHYAKHVQSYNLLVSSLKDVSFQDIKTVSYQTKPDVIFIDYLQLMREANEIKNIQHLSTVIGIISRGLKVLAKDLNIPVVAVSSLNRECDHRPNKRPVMSDLKMSGNIEQDSDEIIFLYRDVVYDKETLNPTVAEVNIAKNRHGPTFTAELDFAEEYVLFRDLKNGKKES